MIIISKKNVICIGAHPDDETNSAGTLAKMANQGYNVYICCVTNGDKGYFDSSMSAKRLAEIRLRELEAAANSIGAKDFINLNYPDGEVLSTRKLRSDLTRCIRKWKATIVFSHDPWRKTEASLDHINIGFMTCHASVYSGFPNFHKEHLKEGIEPQLVEEFFLYGSDEPNFISNITETINQKIESRLCHESQITQGLGPVNNNSKHKLTEEWLQMAARSGKKKGYKYGEEFKVFAGGSGHFEWFPEGAIIKTK